MIENSTIQSKKNIRIILGDLIKLRKIPSGSALAKTLNIPAPTVNRILSGQVADPRASTLSLLADYFSISIDQLLGKVPLTPSQHNHEKIPPQAFLSIPIITSLNYANWQKTLLKPTHWYRWPTDTPSRHSNVFAIQINTHILEPAFQTGTLLVINPSLTAHPFDYIAIQFEQDSFISIRKMMTDGRHHYFHPLQTGHKIISVDDTPHRIIGTVIEAHLDLAHFN